MSETSDRPAGPMVPSRPWIDPAAVLIGLGAAVLVVALWWLLQTPRPDAGPSIDPARIERLEARILAAEAGREQLASLEGRVRQLTAIDTAAQQIPAIDGRIRAAEGLAERAAGAERRLQALEARPAFDPALVVTRADLAGVAARADRLSERLDAEAARAQAAATETAQRLDALTRAQEAAVQAAREGVETRAAALAEQVAQRVTGIEAAVGQRATTLEQSVGQRVGAAEQQVAARLDALDRRLAGIEATVAQRVAAAEQAATQRSTAAEQAAERSATALAERLAAIERAGTQRLDGADRLLAERAQGERTQAERIAGLEQALAARIAALEQAQARVANTEQRNARLAALDALRNTLDAGRPLGGLLPRIGETPPALARYGQAAPPTVGTLRASFEEALRQAQQAADAAAAPDGQAPTATERALRRVAGLVTVRRDNEIVWGETAADDIERARRSLAAGDLEATLGHLEKLPQAAREAMAGWVTQARALLEARAALSRLAG